MRLSPQRSASVQTLLRSAKPCAPSRSSLLALLAVVGCGSEPYPTQPQGHPTASRDYNPGGGAGGGFLGTGGFGALDAGIFDERPDAGFFDGGFCFASGGVDTVPVVMDAGLDMPLPVTGSTLAVASASGFAVAVNADAPSLSFIHIGTATTAADASKNVHVTLSRGEWPFKPVVDSSGTAHVLLRGTGQLLSVNPSTPANVRRLTLCPQPRGLVFDAAQNLLHAACAEGSVLAVSPSTGAVTRTATAPNDLRDLVISNGRLFATRFRSAELFPVSAPDQGAKPQLAPGMLGSVEATVAWRTVATPQGITMVHQRSTVDPISATCSGYGSGPASIVLTGLTVFSTDGGTDAGVRPEMTMHACPGGTLPVDLAASADGTVLAIVEAGAHRVTVITPGTGFVGPPDAGSSPCRTGPSYSTTLRPVGAAFTADNRLVVQTEEPALLVFGAYAKSAGQPAQLGALLFKVQLPGNAVVQTGHRLFHDTTAGNISCASCHPEGMDDGHVWTFKAIGPRRSQTLGGGIANTQPFHWDGDMHTFSSLMGEVMEKRMTGPKLDGDRQAAVLKWIDSIPAQRVPANDAAAASRGKILFESSATGCSGCHSGPLFTNNLTVNVGTGGAFQVPTLVGLGTRAPFMHDGCAKTLADRFGPCGGLTSHGTVTHLSSSQLADLTAYLSTL